MTQRDQNNCLTKNFFAISYLQYNVYYSLFNNNNVYVSGLITGIRQAG